MMPPELPDRLRREGRIILTLKVIPKASKTEIVGWLDDGALKIKVSAAPEKGKANAAVCEFLATELRVPRRNVQILRGETSHTKQVEITSERI
jgi:uncharacterized protein (TIGR00251 family)